MTSSGNRLRRIFSALLIVVVAVLSPLIVTSGWAITTVTSTPRFVATMSPLATNPTVTNWVAQEGATAIVTNPEVEAQIKSHLPASVAFIEPVVVSALTKQLAKVLGTVLQSSAYQRFWTAELRLFHSSFIRVMTSSPSTVSQYTGLAVDLTTQIQSAIAQLDKRGITQLDPVRDFLRTHHLTPIALASEQQFHQAQWYLHVAISLRWILPLVGLLLGAAAILLATRRRRAGVWLGIGIAVSCVVMLALLAAGEKFAVHHASTPPDVARAVISTLTSRLRLDLRLAAIASLLAVGVLWLTGPSSGARSTRGLFRPAHADGTTGSATSGSGAETLAFAARHAVVLSWVGGIVAAVVLVAWTSSFLVAALTVVLAALWIGALLTLQRRAGAQGTTTT